jgi:hypothetical protein
MFTQREPVDPDDHKAISAAGQVGRDVFNEQTGK